MRISKKVVAELADRFEGVLDFIPTLDRVPFSIKREAAQKAAQAAFDFISQEAA